MFAASEPAGLRTDPVPMCRFLELASATHTGRPLTRVPATQHKSTFYFPPEIDGLLRKHAVVRDDGILSCLPGCCDGPRVLREHRMREHERRSMLKESTNMHFEHPDDPMP